VRTLADLLTVPLPPHPLPRQRRAALSGSAPQRGGGEDYWQLRPYTPGDAPRSIAWRSSARGDDVLVLERQRPAAPVCILGLDKDAPDAALAGKVDILELLAAALAYRLRGAGFTVKLSGLQQGLSADIGRLQQQVHASRWTPGMPATLVLSTVLQPIARLQTLLANMTPVAALLAESEQQLPARQGMLRLRSSQGRVDIGEAASSAASYEHRLEQHLEALTARGVLVLREDNLGAALRALWDMCHGY
jgi:uncharacterized protein (DUF58 family)